MQFNRFSHPVAFPSDDQIEEYSKLVQQNNPFNQVSDIQPQIYPNYSADMYFLH